MADYARSLKQTYSAYKVSAEELLAAGIDFPELRDVLTHVDNAIATLSDNSFVTFTTDVDVMSDFFGEVEKQKRIKTLREIILEKMTTLEDLTEKFIENYGTIESKIHDDIERLTNNNANLTAADTDKLERMTVFHNKTAQAAELIETEIIALAASNQIATSALRSRSPE